MKYWQLKYKVKGAEYEVKTMYKLTTLVAGEVVKLGKAGLGKQGIYFSALNGEINTLCMKVMAEDEDYQPVTKNEGTKGFPPFSSLILPGPPFGAMMQGATGLV